MKKIAVIGLYNSGSTAIAGVLHQLGVNMGPPYWRNYWNNHYESRELKKHLCNWWSESDLTEQASRETRVLGFRKWLSRESQRASVAVGFKHPLLCLSASDLVEAWGPDTRLIWAYRPLEESIEKLAKRNWFPDPERNQRILWRSAEAFFETHEHLRVDHTLLLTNPCLQIGKIIEYLDISPESGELMKAVGLIRIRTP